MRRREFATLSLLICAVTAACGGGVQGEYLGKDGETLFNSLTFRSDGKVEIVFVGGKHEGRYEADGESIVMTSPNGDKTLLRVNANGCLTNSLIGIYCKGRSGGSSASAGATAAKSDPPGSEVYEARAREGQIRLEFGAARKARITMVPTGIADAPERMSFDVSYAVDGDQITVNLPGSERLMLTRTDGDLEGTMNGETVRFVKR
jgi:hypothetical protein